MERRLKKAEFLFVEHKLKEYPINKKIIAEYEAQTDHLLHGTRKPMDGQPGGSDISRPTEATAIQLALLENTAKCEDFWIRAIEDVLDILPSEHKRLIELKYFEGHLSNVGVALELGIDERDFYRWRDRILPKFARRFGLI